MAELAVVFLVVLAVVVLYNLWCEWCPRRWQGHKFVLAIFSPLIIGCVVIAILDWRY